MKIQKESRPRSRPRKYQIIFVNENMDYVRKVEELKLEGKFAENWRNFCRS